MSYTPTNPKALAAHEALKQSAPRGKAALLTNISAPYARADLKQILTAYYCPVVCVGEVKGEGWHLTCENVAEAALQQMERNKAVPGGTA